MLSAAAAMQEAFAMGPIKQEAENWQQYLIQTTFAQNKIESGNLFSHLHRLIRLLLRFFR